MKRQFVLETGMFAVLCLLVVIVSFSGIVTYQQLTSLSKDLKKGTQPDNKIAILNQISSQLFEMESNVRAFNFTRDSSYIKTFDQSKNVVDSKLQDLDFFVRNKEITQPRFDSLKFYVNARYAVFNTWIKLERDVAVTKELTKLPANIKTEDTKLKEEDTSLKKKKKNENDEFDFKLLESEVKKIQQTQTNQLKELSEQELLLNMRNKASANGFRDILNQMERDDKKIISNNNIKAIAKANRANFTIAVFCISSVTLLILIALTLFRYIVKTRHYHKALGDARMEAENLAMAKQNFLANMTHEIRTPINSIIGFAEQLDKSALNEAQKEQISIIKKSSLHLLKIVNDVLDYSKLQSGKFSLEKIVFNPTETIQEVIDILLPEVENKDIQLVVDKQSNHAPFLSGDPFRLQQILLNIVGNAIKFTNSGSIYVSIQSEKVNTEESLLKIEVKDTGIGIPASKVDKVFDDFEQAEADMARRFRGTGLGLSITKKLVEMQNGSIHINSTEGRGTIVNILIPYEIASNNLSENGEVPNIDTELLKNKKILIVDDEPFNRKLLRTILAQWGGKIEEAHDGENALYLVANHTYDLILMDIRMPGITGIEVSRKIRENGNKTIIIALTASNDEEKQKQCIEAGMNAFLSKPFTENKLFEVISNTIKSTSMQQNKIEQNIRELNKLGNNDPTFTNEMLNLFLKGTEQGLKTIQDAYETDNWKAIQDMAHKIAPSCRHLGAFRMLEILKTLESKAGTDVHKADIGVLIKELEVESITTIDEVKKYLV
jgi:signal transduction histidine kinase/CheY-like chemotaxis protein